MYFLFISLFLTLLFTQGFKTKHRKNKAIIIVQNAVSKRVKVIFLFVGLFECPQSEDSVTLDQGLPDLLVSYLSGNSFLCGSKKARLSEALSIWNWGLVPGLRNGSEAGATPGAQPGTRWLAGSPDTGNHPGGLSQVGARAFGFCSKVYL